jgi:hypothetical protein
MPFPGRIGKTMSKSSTPEMLDLQKNPYRSRVSPVSLNSKFFESGGPEIRWR